MRLVSETSETDVARQRHAPHVAWALRELTANLLRVVRGAGKRYYIAHQAQTLLEKMAAYREGVGCLPSSDELTAMLDIDKPSQALDGMSDDQLDVLYAEAQIISGALQLAASRLLDQSLQIAAGHREMRDGARALQTALGNRQKAWEERRQALRRQMARPKASRKPSSQDKSPISPLLHSDSDEGHWAPFHVGYFG
jgi:hypothetical protein